MLARRRIRTLSLYTYPRIAAKVLLEVAKENSTHERPVSCDGSSRFSKLGMIALSHLTSSPTNP